MIINGLLGYKNGVMGKYVFGLVFLIMMTSCGEDVDIFVPKSSQAVGGDISRLTTKLKQDFLGDIHYTATCDCQGDQFFEFDKDLVLVIPPQFVNLNQFPCPQSGHYNLEVTVCDTKGEIMIAGIPTISENNLLESRIEFNVQITSEGQEVKLDHGKRIRILVNDPDPRDRMELFYGNGTDWLQADGNPDTWDNVGTDDWVFQDSTGGDPVTGFGYSAFSDSTDWINVDVFHTIPVEQRTPVCVELPAEFTNTNAEVFMVFKDYKSVTYMHGDSSKMQFCEGHQSTPIGFRVTFVVIAEQGEGEYFFAAKDAVITPNMTEVIVPKRTPYEEIKNYIVHL